jgi:hypothetical protein
MRKEKNNYLKSGFLLITVLIIVLAGQSCEELFNSKVCTLEFRYLMVSVVDGDENPVRFDEVSVTNYRTGDAIDLCDSEPSLCIDEIAGNPEMGYYTIYHDGLRGDIGFRPISVLFDASNDSVSVQQLYLIGDDGCHVYKMSGPEVIAVE